MRFIREFSYPDVFQRRTVFYSSFSTVIVVAYMVTSLSIFYRRLNPYESLFLSLLIYGLAGFFLGNISGKILFKKLASPKILLGSADIVFSLLSLSFILRPFLLDSTDEFLHLIYGKSGFLPAVFLSTAGYLVGVKMNYILKIVCGDFIDEKKAIITFVISTLTAAVVGVVVAGLVYFSPVLNYLFLLPLGVILVTVFIIKLPYNPSPIFAQEHRDEETVQLPALRREDLLFTYLNFTYILVYLFLGHQTIIKFFSAHLQVQLYFIVVCLAGLLAGFSLSRLTTARFRHIYTEMLYPVLFVLFMIMLHTLSGSLKYYSGILLFVPVTLLFGFSIYHTLDNILLNYTHNGRFTIIDFSLFILPFPIYAVLQLMEFSYLWFFLFLYFIMSMNIIFPGIHLLQHSTRNYQKVLFFIYSLIFIPVLIFNHLYFKIPMNSQLYVQYTSGFNTLFNSNYHTKLAKSGNTIFYNRDKAFISDPDTIKNYHRSLVAAGIIINTKEGGDGTVLFINGNAKFVHSPLVFPVEKTRILDYIPDRSVDYQRPPLSGSKAYAGDRKAILPFFLNTKEKFRAIIDSPNLYDQTNTDFRFGSDFYKLTKRNMKPDGILVQIVNSSHCREEFLCSIVENLKKTFKRSAVFMFSDHLVFISADSDNALSVSENNIGYLKNLIKNDKDVAELFYNEYQPLTHLLYSDTGEMKQFIPSRTVSPAFFLSKPIPVHFNDKMIEEYLNNNMRILDLISNKPPDAYYKNTLNQIIRGSAPIYTLLKEAFYHEYRREYEQESENLYQLKKFAEYLYELRSYINGILSFKKDFYFREALRLEGDKQWDQAARLYRAILKIQPDNFDANYRMGILSITVQNLEEAFIYLQHAMQLKRDDSKVLYQMGVLLFSSDRPQDALTYFNRAVEMQENTASIYNYMGLCYEKLGMINDAKNSYLKAVQMDPNDVTLQSSLERINRTIDEEKNRWKLPDQKNQSDVEQGENIPLPINKSARDIRLKDNE